MKDKFIQEQTNKINSFESTLIKLKNQEILEDKNKDFIKRLFDVNKKCSN